MTTLTLRLFSTLILVFIASYAGPVFTGPAEVIFTVNTLTDKPDLNIGDGVCDSDAAAGEQCTLRAAIMEANVKPASDTVFINLPSNANPYQLSIPPKDDDGDSSGDLNIKRNMTLSGELPAFGGSDISAGNEAIRIFRVHAGATVALEHILMRDGKGAVLNEGTLTLRNVRVSGSGFKVASPPPAIDNKGTLRVESSSIDNNFAGQHGAGLFNEGTLVIKNSTVSGNKATDGSGGGIYQKAGSAELYNVTLAFNEARDGDGKVVESGGGIFVEGGTLSLKNTVLAGNLDPMMAGDDCKGTVQSLGYNLIQEPKGCTITGETTGNILSKAPLLLPLADNSNPASSYKTPTHLPDTKGPVSPLIDVGSPDGCLGGEVQASAKETTSGDQRNFSRIEDGDGDGTKRCDIGSVEVGCGDSILEKPEQCDDGNKGDGDGCSALCLSEISVNANDDLIDADLNDGKCDADLNTAGDQCTLRAAIMEANVRAAKTAVFLPSGSYPLKLQGNEDAAKSGDIDVLKDLTLTGGDYFSPDVTVISGEALGGDRLFEIHPGATVSMQRLTLTRGGSGGITNKGTLTLTKVWVTDNSGGPSSRGIDNSGDLKLDSVSVTNNGSNVNPIGVDGGGILHLGPGTLTVVNSTISGNVQTGDGGGIYATAPVKLYNVTIANNTADVDKDNNGNGGGIALGQNGSVTLQNTIIAGNIDATNTDPGVVDPDCAGTLTSLGYNLIGKKSVNCTVADDKNLIGLDPLLESLFIDTMTHTPKAGSPAIDKGDPQGCKDDKGASLGKDQLGRAHRGPCDVGAVEFQGRCGDNFFQPGLGEQCDDGNLQDGDGCDALCKTEVCGDGKINNSGKEQCDNGAANSDTAKDACRKDCTKARCGDGVADSNEGCDDGNQVETDACRNSCVSATCGDGTVQASVEQCDAGGDNSDSVKDACRKNCTKARCGDTVIDTGEECDDGNLKDSDGCSASCKKEPAPSPAPEPVTKPVSPIVSPSPAPSPESASVCGNGAKEGVEECDDGNTTDGDGCSAICKTEAAGTPGGSIDSGAPGGTSGSPDGGSAQPASPAAESAGGCSCILVP